MTVVLKVFPNKFWHSTVEARLRRLIKGRGGEGEIGRGFDEFSYGIEIYN